MDNRISDVHVIGNCGDGKHPTAKASFSDGSFLILLLGLLQRTEGSHFQGRKPFLISQQLYLIEKLINNHFSFHPTSAAFNQQFDEVSKAFLGFFIARAVVNVNFPFFNPLAFSKSAFCDVLIIIPFFFVAHTHRRLLCGLSSVIIIFYAREFRGKLIKTSLSSDTTRCRIASAPKKPQPRRRCVLMRAIIARRTQMLIAKQFTPMLNGTISGPAIARPRT